MKKKETKAVNAMAFCELKFHSDALGRAVSANVILPESAKTLIGMSTGASETYKTIYLLHGLSDDHTIWSRRTSIERYASEYGIAVVMPNADRSWYTDMPGGANYFTFITEELPKACRGFFRGMSDKREDNFIGGLSMGGYGAIKAALTYPEKYFGCICLSGALDIPSYSHHPIEEWRTVFGHELGDISEVRGTRHDVFALAKANAKEGKPFPKIYMWCGNDDYILESSIRFDKWLTELGVEHVYEQSEGNHSWPWWDLHVQDGLGYVLG